MTGVAGMRRLATRPKRAGEWAEPPVAKGGRLARSAWTSRVLLALAVAGVAAVMVTARGSHNRAVALEDGSAWMVSSATGQAALVDGAAAQVVAQVSVGAGQLAGVGSGSDEFVANATTGTVRRVTGATFASSAPVRVTAPGRPVTLYAGGGRLYALDPKDGLLTGVDPVTLRPSTRTAVGVGTRAEAAVADAAGRFWLLDGASGELVRVDGANRQVLGREADPASIRLVAAGGHAVVVDLAARDVRELGGDGSTTARACLDVAADDTSVTLGGSGNPGGSGDLGGAGAPGLVLAVSGRGGLLSTARLGRPGCDATIDLGAAGHDLGAPAQTGGRAFVADRTAGTVIVVDLTSRRVVARPVVLPPKTRFDLISRGPYVFYNDPGSDRAGVMRVDTLSTRAVAKYRGDDPAAGVVNQALLTAPAPSLTPVAAPGAPGPSGSPAPAASGSASPPPSAAARPRPAAGTGDAGPGMNPPPVGARVQPGRAGPGPGSGSGSPNGQVIQDGLPTIELSAGAVRTGEALTVRAAPAPGTAIRSVTWTFGDGQTDEGTQTTHTWTAAGAYQVSAQVTLTDGHVLSVSATITVTTVPPPCAVTAALTVSTSSSDDRRVTADASGSKTCGKQISTYAFTFGDQPSGQGASPQAGYTFDKDGTYEVTVVLTAADGTTANAGQTVTVAGPPDPPTGVQAAPEDAGVLKVTWTDASDNEDGFVVTNTTDNTSHTVAADGTSYLWTGLTNGQEYCFDVHSRNSHGSSKDASGCGTPKRPPPLVPVAGSGGTGAATITWTDSVDEQGFTVWNTSTNETRDVAGTARSYTWTDLTPGEQVCFRVRASTASGLTDYQPADPGACYTPPSTPPSPPPSGVAATPAGTGGVQVTWVDNSSDETSFEVSDGGDEARTVGANVTSATFAVVAPDQTLCFRVRALNDAGSSDWSSPSCVTTPSSDTGTPEPGPSTTEPQPDPGPSTPPPQTTPPPTTPPPTTPPPPQTTPPDPTTEPAAQPS